MGPGILIKALLQSSFSLMVFGWTQIIMDIQPLVILLMGEGHLHGFTHTFLGATLIAITSAISGKYLSELGLRIIGVNEFGFNQIRKKSNKVIIISWKVAFISALIGSYTHVLLDAIMHGDVQPFYPFNLSNELLGLISISSLHKSCLYSGLIGASIFYFVQWKKFKEK